MVHGAGKKEKEVKKEKKEAKKEVKQVGKPKQEDKEDASEGEIFNFNIRKWLTVINQDTWIYLAYLCLLHKYGSNNPLGINTDITSVPFYPYFYVKDFFNNDRSVFQLFLHRKTLEDVVLKNKKQEIILIFSITI